MGKYEPCAECGRDVDTEAPHCHVCEATECCKDAEREAIARVVAWLRATPGERGLPWVDYAHDIADMLETGDWRSDDA